METKGGLFLDLGVLGYTSLVTELYTPELMACVTRRCIPAGAVCEGKSMAEFIEMNMPAKDYSHIVTSECICRVLMRANTSRLKGYSCPRPCIAMKVVTV